MTISWDQNQLPALSKLLEEKLPLLTGEVVVMSGDIPPNCFAGSVDLSGREFTVYSSSDSSIVDLTINVFLGYIVAMAYDKHEWAALPPADVLSDCHREVCSILLDFNEDFARTLEDHADLLDEWHRTHSEANLDVEPERDQEEILDELTRSMFNPTNSKDYGAN